LLSEIITDSEIAARLRLAPAAKMMHHAYLGGLLEHIVSLCRMCEFASIAYPSLNRDILLAGAVLHDVGKIEELRYTSALEYSDEGRLLGHINFGVQLLRSKLGTVVVEKEIALQVEHLILSHHGSKELGSPVEPSTPEALIFSHLDNLDAKAYAIRDAITRLRNGTTWTESVPAFRRPFRLTHQTAQERAAPES
jgi:3'-5' exoribonuclease